MKPEFLQAVEQLKQWIAAGSVELTRQQMRKGVMHSSTETLCFRVKPLSEAELQDISQLCPEPLPAAYMHLLREVGCGEFFIDEFRAAFDIFGIEELQQAASHIAQEIAEEDEPTEDSFFMIGVHNSMGDWMGFCTSRTEPDNYEVFNHEVPIYCYAEDAFWKNFEDWVIAAVKSKGQETL